ncbi:hypothetical protein [Peribacillus kribbensis]|nr:hypothetical protein [Peribacillus kribbensis]
MAAGTNLLRIFQPLFGAFTSGRIIQHLPANQGVRFGPFNCEIG